MIRNDLPKKSLGSLGEENEPMISSIIKDKMVEAAGIEPASREQEPKEPTCLVSVLNLGLEDTR